MYCEQGQGESEDDLQNNLPHLEEISDSSDRDSGGHTDSDGALEESEEEDLSDEDDSHIDELVDNLQAKFRTLVDSRIAQAEEFFDDPDLLLATCLVPSMESLFPPKPVPVQISSSNTPVGETGTQTDDEIFVTKSSGTLVSTESVPCSTSGPEQARLEISNLREVRDYLVSQRQKWESHRKSIDETKPEEIRHAECKVYQIEEAIESVETVIEFKNEVILGQTPRKIFLNEDLLLDTSEGQLLTRLETLSVDELRRLLSKYINKVVEMRYSTRRQEKSLEHFETLNKQLHHRVTKEQKDLLEMDKEYQTRIRAILQPGSADFWYSQMKEQLVTAKKKQNDLERSLTALLVSHGYLENGSDYDVKQVVQKLSRNDNHRGAVPHRAGPVPRISTRPPSTSRRHRLLDGMEPVRHPRLPLGHDLRDKEPSFQGQSGGTQSEVRREKKRIIIQPNENRHYNQNYK